MSHWRWLPVAMVASTLTAAGGAETAPSAQLPAYTRQATWQETMLACRASLVRALEDGTDARQAVELGPWYTTGPLSLEGPPPPLFPAQQVDLRTRGENGQPVWQRQPAWHDCQVHDLPADNQVATYLFRTITAARPVQLPFFLGSDDDVEVWLNGIEVFRQNLTRGARPDQDLLFAKLAAGENRLLMKVVNRDGGQILFAWKKSDRKDDYHLYQWDVAAGSCRQLTFGLGLADYEGAYLPGGDIVFNSTRCVQTVDCWTTEVSNLFACDKDGRCLRRLSYDQVHTNFPNPLSLLYRQPKFKIYLMTIDGRRELLAADPAISCNQPIPLRPQASAPAAKPDGLAMGHGHVLCAGRLPGLGA